MGIRDRSGVAEVFRSEWSRLVATLVRDFGDLELAEEVAQDAFLEAASRWETTGPPDRPGAWLLTTARRKAIDQMRRTERFEQRRPELARRAVAEPRSANGLVDDQLGLLLGCCHPALDTEAQVALTLRIVGGLSTAQIAKAFLVSESTMTRRLTRAKTKIRTANIPFVVPDRTVLAERVSAVSGVVYLIFTEGHTSGASASLVRGDLCDEAIWLAQLLAELLPDDPEVLGLLALLLLTDARRATRVDADGRPVLLEDQDRTVWDREQIEQGLTVLARAHELDGVGPYQLQAAIAGVHSTARSFDQTDWTSIVCLYDRLLAHQPSPIVALNRAIAVSYADGPQSALTAVDALAGSVELESFPYYHAARAELLVRIGREHDAVASFHAAIDHATNDVQEAHLRRRLDEVLGDSG